MNQDKISISIKDLEEALICSKKLTNDANKILTDFSSKLKEFSEKTDPIRNRAQALTTASQNIKLAKEKCERLLTSLDVSRKVQSVITRGPKGNMNAFLAAIYELQAALRELEANQSMTCVKEAVTHAKNLLNEAMNECEADFMTTLSNNLVEQTPEVLARSTSCELVRNEALPTLKILSDTMLKGAHQRSTRVYIDIRSDCVERMFKSMGLTNVTVNDLQSLSLEQLEKKIQTWTLMAQALVGVCREEKRISKEIFVDATSNQIFSKVVEGTLNKVIVFGKHITKTKHPPEKLFSLLDMHLHLEEVLTKLKDIFAETARESVIEDFFALRNDIAVAASEIFDAFQDSVAADSTKKDISDGTVHPLCATVLSFFKRLFKHSNFMQVLYGNALSEVVPSQFQLGNQMSATMVRILMILQENLENKSKAYKSKALATIFMMNNIHFMVKSIELSQGIQLLGNDWLVRHRNIVLAHASDYYHLVWEPILQKLSTEGDDVNNNNLQRKKTAIKDRFKSFNNAFDDIHHVQSEWAIPDSELKETIKKNILNGLMPSYRKFLAAYKDWGFTKHLDRYIKYEPENIERVIKEDLFENKINIKESWKSSLLL